MNCLKDPVVAMFLILPWLQIPRARIHCPFTNFLVKKEKKVAAKKLKRNGYLMFYSIASKQVRLQVIENSLLDAEELEEHGCLRGSGFVRI